MKPCNYAPSFSRRDVIVHAFLFGISEIFEYLPQCRYPQSIVLENLTQRFYKPNILDIKLGSILHDHDATPEKKARMEKTARETTSFETGIRITGFQVR